MRGAVLGAVVLEGWADSIEAAARLVDAGEIGLEPCHHHGAVAPGGIERIAHREPGVGQIGAGVTSAPMACFVAAVKALAGSGRPIPSAQ